MAAIRSQIINDLIDQCLPTCLTQHGYTVSLRHPDMGEGFSLLRDGSRQEAEEDRRIVRRIVCGIVGAVLEEYVR